jgi:hypothetical protein
MIYSLANTLVNIRKTSTETVVIPNNGYVSPSPNFFYYVAPNQSYYIQPTP